MKLEQLEGTHWVGTDSREEFTILAIWNPNEEQDPWVRYRRQDDTEYTCRLEAFQTRFRRLPE
jgi:hypothetical protein